MDCPDEQTLGQLIEGVAVAARAELLEHVEDCELCRSITETLLAGDDAPLECGSIVGRYEIVRLVGAGAMGMVYEARDPELDRLIAVKVVRFDRPEATSVLRDRLRAEARSLARVTSPHVVVVYDVGNDERGDVFVAMELVEGETLREWLARGSRSVREIVTMFAGAGRGLAAAHAAGVIHRDFKPDNVLVGVDGRARVGDFGLARAGETVAAGGDREPSAIATRAAGTPAYMAPEQRDGGRIGPRADQYAFCVALAEALGQPDGDPRISGHVPERLRRAIERGRSQAPEDRWPTMDALVDELERTVTRRPRRVGLASGAIVLAVVTGLTVWWTTRPTTSTCDGGQIRIASLWNGARAENLRARLAETKAAPSVMVEVDRLLARWQVEWASEHDLTCKTRDTLADDQLRARVACLEAERDRADAVIRAIETSTRPDLQLVVRALQELPQPGTCARRFTADAREDHPRRSELDRRLADARAMRWTGRAREGVAEARRIRDEARGLGLTALERRASLEIGRLGLASGQHALARTHLEESVAMAIERDDTIGQLDALIALAELLAGDGERSTAEAIGVVARAVVQRHGGDAPREAAIDVAMCYAIERKVADRARDDLTRAAELCRRGRDALVAAHGPDDLRVVDAERKLNDVLWRAGDFEGALAACESALARIERVFGPSSPARDPIRNDIGHVWMSTGRLAEAERVFRELVARYPDNAMWRDSLAMALRGRRAFAEEVEVRREVLRRCTADGHALCASWQYPNLAFLLAELAQFDEAERYIAEADRSPVPPLPHDQMQLAFARARIALGRREPAVARVETARAGAMLSRRVDHPELAPYRTLLRELEAALAGYPRNSR
jgi:hypothetical protein